MSKKTKKPEQLRIKGTGRLDAIEDIEKAGKNYQAAVATRAEAHADETVAQDALTAALVKHKKTEYLYDGLDGSQYCAYVPKEKKAKARVRKVKRKQPDTGDGED